MSARGFLLTIHDDDSFDEPVIRPISPNIIISRSDFFAAGNYIVFMFWQSLIQIIFIDMH